MNELARKKDEEQSKRLAQKRALEDKKRLENEKKFKAKTDREM
jgi:hypothetical protein